MPIEEVLWSQFTPAITGGHIWSYAESDLLVLSIKFASLGFQNAVQIPYLELSHSKEIKKNLTEIAIFQNKEFQNNNENVNNIKKKLKAAKVLSHKTNLIVYKFQCARETIHVIKYQPRLESN